MKIVLDQIARRKLLAIKNESRVFVLEFPVDSTLPELFNIASELKNELWQAIQREEEEKQKTEKDNIVELPIPEDEKED